ncbi:MAG TPA: hypothetical protein VLF94_05130 [Chlamydiales bacterium]|nr:hypothetical protein [Chlamydiales bacterium]
MDLLVEILKKSPWWVYFVFFGLLLIGLKSTKPRPISIQRIFLLPFIFMILNLIWLGERLKGPIFPIIYWFVGLAVGIAIGWFWVRKWVIKIYKHDTILLPPTWSVFVLTILFFFIRYFFAFNYEMHPRSAAHLFVADALISGAMTGIFIGRALHLFTKFHRLS